MHSKNKVEQRFNTSVGDIEKLYGHEMEGIGSSLWAIRSLKPDENISPRQLKHIKRQLNLVVSSKVLELNMTQFFEFTRSKFFILQCKLGIVELFVLLRISQFRSLIRTAPDD